VAVQGSDYLVLQTAGQACRVEEHHERHILSRLATATRRPELARRTCSPEERPAFEKGGPEEQPAFEKDDLR
jgi:hypothetical protein